MTSEELEQYVNDMLIELRSDDDDRIETAKEQLLQLAPTVGIRTLHSHLESVKRSEMLVVQWEIQDVLETLIPPVVEEEKEDDPTKRELRESELQMMAQVPQQGLVLFKSKVDTRWVLMQIDPYTGQLMGKQELDQTKGEDIYKKMNQNPGF